MLKHRTKTEIVSLKKLFQIKKQLHKSKKDKENIFGNEMVKIRTNNLTTVTKTKN